QFRSDLFGSADKVSLIFAFFRIDHDDQSPGFQGRQGVVEGMKRIGVGVGRGHGSMESNKVDKRNSACVLLQHGCLWRTSGKNEWCSELYAIDSRIARLGR